MDLVNLCLAMGRPGGEGEGGGSWPFILMIVAMFAILYFLMIRPQRQREARRKEMLGQLKKADHVVTIGGIRGVVTAIRGDDVVLKVDEANNVKMTFTRSAVARVIDKSTEGEGGDDQDKA